MKKVTKKIKNKKKTVYFRFKIYGKSGDNYYEKQDGISYEIPSNFRANTTIIDIGEDTAFQILTIIR